MKERKKVLHIAEAMGGGVFTYLVELANGISDEFEVTIAYGVRSETPNDFADYFEENIHLIQINNFCRGVNPVSDLKAYLELRKIIKEIKPDIIHMHSSKAGALGRIMVGTKGIKKFYTPHGYSFLMQDASAIKKIIYEMIEKFLGKTKCMTVACGESEWEQSKKVTNLSTFISNGVNVEKIKNSIGQIEDIENQNKKGKNFTVYTVGRINYQKNPELFNEIAGRLPEIDFVWIGDGEMRECLFSENIIVTGWLDNRNAMKMAQDFDVFILPSRWEGLPISLLEAMYLKKICVVSNVVGNKDVIHNGQSGYICNSVDEFVEAINCAKDKPDKEMTQKAYKEIVEHYNSGWLCEKYKELYCE